MLYFCICISLVLFCSHSHVFFLWGLHFAISLWKDFDFDIFNDNKLSNNLSKSPVMLLIWIPPALAAVSKLLQVDLDIKFQFNTSKLCSWDIGGSSDSFTEIIFKISRICCYNWNDCSRITSQKSVVELLVQIFVQGHFDALNYIHRHMKVTFWFDDNLTDFLVTHVLLDLTTWRIKYFKTTYTG